MVSIAMMSDESTPSSTGYGGQAAVVAIRATSPLAETSLTDLSSATMTPNTEELEADDVAAQILSSIDMDLKQTPNNSSETNKGVELDQRADDLRNSSPDEELLKRLLAQKRLSEGRLFTSSAAMSGSPGNGGSYMQRKNSLAIIDSTMLPPVTEGEPMRHMSYSNQRDQLLHQTNQLENSSSISSGSSGSLRSNSNRNLQGSNGNLNGGTRLLQQHHQYSRNSQDEITCSSSTSLESSRSPTRRRSSTVSQCSSVLSEGTRQLLNFDLSPDLAPEASLLEANTLSTGNLLVDGELQQDYCERPASPEPDGNGDFETVSSNMSSPQFDDLDFFRSESRCLSSCSPQLIQLQQQSLSSSRADSMVHGDSPAQQQSSQSNQQPLPPDNPEFDPKTMNTVLVSKIKVQSSTPARRSPGLAWSQSANQQQQRPNSNPNSATPSRDTNNGPGSQQTRVISPLEVTANQHSNNFISGAESLENGVDSINLDTVASNNES